MINDTSASLYYNVKLSNGKEFNAVRFAIVGKYEQPDIHHLSFSILGSTLEEVKDLIKEPITSLTVTTYRRIAPLEYEQKVEEIDISEYNNYGANIMIEPYYNYGHTLKLFYITDELKEAIIQEQTIMETMLATTEVFEMAIMQTKN